MCCQHVDVIEVQVLEDYKLRLQFDDGSCGVVDISKIVPFTGIFVHLHDKDFFSKVSVHSDSGTICWENNVDLSPTYLHEQVKSQSK